MLTLLAKPHGCHLVPESLAQRRWALWLLLTTGCGLKTALDVTGSEPPVGAAGAGGRGGLPGSGGATRTGGVVGKGGTSGESGGAAGSSSSGGCTLDTDHPGYLNCGPWHGYAWTLATEPDMGSTISPVDFTTTAGLPFCAQGVLATVDSAVGLVGFNVNQSAEGDTSQGTWTVTGNGLKYALGNPGGSPLRIQIQGAAGWPDETWCADISGTTSGSVPWSTFNQACWASIPSLAYDGQTPLEQVMLLVPGVNGREQAFDICLVALYPY